MERGRASGRPVLTDLERDELLSWTRRRLISRSYGYRARIVLLTAEGRSDGAVAAELGLDRGTVGIWRRRFNAEGIDGLADRPRSGAPRRIDDDKVEEVVVTTLEGMPRGATHWSTRSMARKVGISSSSVGRIWRAFGLKPHRADTFQLSNDPFFVEKVRDVVGLYMSPPDNAVILSVDEKSQIQALNRTQPVLPMRPGQIERRTPEYRRHGTTSLFAALDVATGAVIGRCYRRHRTAEFLKFLKHIDETVEDNLEIHVVLDNYCTHKSAPVRRWLQRNPRFHLHFTPTHSSWLNQVEAFFSILTEKQIKRSAHTSVRQLEASIYEFLDAYNDDPQPFRWNKTADQILSKLAGYCRAITDVHGEVVANF